MALGYIAGGNVGVSPGSSVITANRYSFHILIGKQPESDTPQK